MLVVVVVVMVVVGVMVSALMLRSQRSRTGGCESLDKFNCKHSSTFGMECNTFFFNARLAQKTSVGHPNDD